LREQLRRAAHEYFLLPAHGRELRSEFHAGDSFRAGSTVWIQAGNPPSQRED
jgi:hypothetical protein